MHLHEYMSQLRKEINACLVHQLKSAIEGHRLSALSEAMLYSVKNGGKRLRPILLLMTLEAFGVERKMGMEAAVTLEMIHTYSLIHDDLPAMDDDGIRRGKPTNHKVYGEAIAILAGDGLLTDAFGVIANSQMLDAQTKLKLVLTLSHAAGSFGMIEGQLLDMESEGKSITIHQLRNIHQLKTGRLIQFACIAAGVIAKQDKSVRTKLSQFAATLGVAFQIKDDILDVEGDTVKTGKSIGSDVASKKSTYVSLLGLAGAKQMLAGEIEKALQILDALPIKKDLLKDLTQYVANRDN